MNPIAKLLAFVLGVVAMSCGGCNVLGFGANAVGGGITSTAQFTMAKRPTVIMAEKFSNPSESRADEEPLCRFIADEMAAHDIAPVVDPDKVYSLENENPAKWRTMTIAAAGRAAGGEQILYVNIINISLDRAEASDMTRGRGDVRVRLVDAQSGATIWPTDASDGYPVAAETRMFRVGQNGITESSLRGDLLRMLGSRVVQLFYTVKSD